MLNFTQIEFDNSLHRFRMEEIAGRRYRMGELITSIWLKDNNINFDEVKKMSMRLPDARLVIIGEGDFAGFYIYSNKLQLCFKYSLVLENA